jgi:putative glycosyltransferase (TIGR04372 family)
MGNYQDYKLLFLSLKRPIINRYLYSLFKSREFFIDIDNKFLSYLIDSMSLFFFINLDIDSYVLKPKANRSVYTISNRWGIDNTTISIPDEDQKIFTAYKNTLGMANDSWYVIFHARDHLYSPNDEIIQSHRNHSVDNMLETANYVAEQGGYSIIYTNEKSKVSQKNLKIKLHKRVIFHVSIKNKTEMLDVLLCANARYFIGGTSGLFYVSKIFNIPVIITNGIPLTALPPQLIDLFIPKLIYSKNLKRYLKISELFDLNINRLFTAEDYRKHNLVAIENSSKEILDSFKTIYDNSMPSESILSLQYKKRIKSSDYGYNSHAMISEPFLIEHY